MDVLQDANGYTVVRTSCGILFRDEKDINYSALKRQVRNPNANY